MHTHNSVRDSHLKSKLSNHLTCVISNWAAKKLQSGWIVALKWATEEVTQNFQVRSTKLYRNFSQDQIPSWSFIINTIGPPWRYNISKYPSEWLLVLLSVSTNYEFLFVIIYDLTIISVDQWVKKYEGI